MENFCSSYLKLQHENQNVNFFLNNRVRLSQLSSHASGIYPPANRVPTLDFELIEDDARQLKAVKAESEIHESEKFLQKAELEIRLSFYSTTVDEIIKSCTWP